MLSECGPCSLIDILVKSMPMNTTYTFYSVFTSGKMWGTPYILKMDFRTVLQNVCSLLTSPNCMGPSIHIAVRTPKFVNKLGFARSNI